MKAHGITSEEQGPAQAPTPPQEGDLITEITFPADLAGTRGLQPATLRGLRSLVVLAGANGSGKSRYLGLIPDVVNAARSSQQELVKRQRRLDGYKSRVSSEPKNREALEAEIAKLEPLVEKARGSALLVKGDPGAWAAIPLSSDNLAGDFAEPESLAPKDYHTRLKQLSRVPFSVLHRDLPIYLDSVANALFIAGHPELKNQKGVVQAAESASRYNETLRMLLGTSVEYQLSAIRPAAMLFGRPLKLNELSAGQRLLLCWATTLHLRSQSFVGQILLVDEPEKHLHPHAAVQVLERLRAAVGSTGQVWVATHSPAIVAYFGHESVFLVLGGRVEFAGSRVNDVMDGLLGGPDSRRQLIEFLGEAEQVALLKFGVEALFNQAAAPARTGDPQESLFLRTILDRRSPPRPLRVLDYGAGRGRFAAAIAERLGPSAATEVDYHALNLSGHDHHHDECLANIARIYGEASAAQRTHTEISDFWGAGEVALIRFGRQVG